MHGSRRLALAALVCVALVGVGCSGGADRSGDPLEETGRTGQVSVSIPGSGGFKLGGTLARPPDAKGTAPGVLIVPTLGSVDRNGIQSPTLPDPLYEDLSKSFTAAGMVTLRYDRRGIGASKLSGGKVTYDDLVGDAQAALKFLTARKEVAGSPVAVVGHDMSGPIALRVAGDQPRVKSVVLLSSPGRPAVDVLADGFAAANGQAMADRFRSIVADLVATGSLPPPDAIPAQLQTILGQGQEQVLKGVFTVDPAAEAARVKVPVMIVISSSSSAIGHVDADRLAQAVGPTAEVAVTSSGTTLREIVPDRPPVAFDPNNDSTHVFGARIVEPVPRDQASVDKITAWLARQLGGSGK